MKKLRIVNKLLTFITCSVITVCCIASYSGTSNHVEVSAAKTLAEIQEERKANEAKIKEFQDKINALEGNKDKEKEYQQTLLNSIELIQSNILLLNNELERINTEILTTETNITDLNKNIAEQEIKVDENLEIFKERLCAMYVTGNNSLASAILGSSNFYDMLSRMEMVNSIAAHDEELVNQILSEIESLEESKKQLETAKLTLEMKLEDQEKKKEEKQSEINELNEYVKKTQDEIKRIELEQEKLERSKEQIKADQDALDQQETEIRNAIRKAQEEEAKRQQLQQQQNNNNNNNSGGANLPEYVTPNPGASGFMWPTPGNYYISSYFGWRWGKLHAGIDVGDAGIGGDPVVASKSGTVAYVYSACTHNFPKSYRCCGGGYGNYVIVQHEGTYSTLYAHLSYVNVSVGEYVTQGQTLGGVGCTGHSTGDHLHFEVRRNGSATDPMGYVSP